jgi:L-asparaginase II
MSGIGMLSAMSTSASPRSPRRRASAAARSERLFAPAPPVLVEQHRGSVVESRHRGHIVEVDASGAVVRAVGDPDVVVNLRSAMKPFALVALLEAGGIAAFDLSPAEVAVMASSHSGEDAHVRTIQSVLRRAGVSQSLLACGTEGAPLDTLTAARLLRDGERPGPIRHQCSGQHASTILLARLKGWSLDDYWRDEHPAQAAVRWAVATAFGVTEDDLVTAVDECGVLTYAFSLREIARAYALLADPEAIMPRDPRAEVARWLLVVRDAMLANAEMVAGTRDRLDTSLAKVVPGRVVSKGGAEALRGVAILGGQRAGRYVGPSGMALKIEDGDGRRRANHAASVEALRQAGVLDAQAVRMLARYARPATADGHGRAASEAIPIFELAPLEEMVR